jgi:hypothetical protein
MEHNWENPTWRTRGFLFPNTPSDHAQYLDHPRHGAKPEFESKDVR